MSPPPTLLIPHTALPAILTCHNLHQRRQQNFTLNPTFFQRASSSTLLPFPPHSVGNSVQNDSVEEDDEPFIIGDCLVFEEGIFDDPFLQDESFKPQKNNSKPRGKASAEVVPENLIPEKWAELRREINITKKERRRLAQELDYGRKVEKRRESLTPVEERAGVRRVSAAEFGKYQDEKLKQLNPVVLDKPEFLKAERREKKGDEAASGSDSSSARVKLRNPRREVYGGGLEDISKFFNSGNYDPNAAKNPEGPRKLFSKDEKLLLSSRIPDLAIATSEKWQPLHSLVASGEFYLVNALLKHNVDINLANKDGLTAIHKAILGKKHAIFSYLLRECANPFVCDKEGASLMHYAVLTASSQMIKILLLYNVGKNLQDDDGWTPLHLAVQSRRADIVRILLIKGADKTLRNKDGLTPLDLCLYSGKDTRTYELIKLLKHFPRSHAG